MGKKSGPPAPDYTAAAKEQSNQSQQLALNDTYANRPTVNTPWGKQTWQTSSTIDPATGKPVTSWEQNIELSPDQQASLDSQQRIQMGRSNAAEDLLGQATSQFSKEVDWGSMPGRAGNIENTGVANKSFGFGGDWRQKAQDSITALQKPMLDERRADTENKLANMGLARGSEAWDREMRRVSDDENRAMLAAIDSGRAESDQSYNQARGAAEFENNAGQLEFSNRMNAGNFNNMNRSGAIMEELQRRGTSLNELNALLTGQQVSMPNMPTAPRATMGQSADLMGAAQAQYNAGIDQFNARQAGIGNLINAGATAGSAFMFSDIRLKEDIREMGLLGSGIRVVHYRYRGLPGRFIGVIAQEVAQVLPEAVAMHPSGYLMVDYARIH